MTFIAEAGETKQNDFQFRFHTPSFTCTSQAPKCYLICEHACVCPSLYVIEWVRLYGLVRTPTLCVCTSLCLCVRARMSHIHRSIDITKVACWCLGLDNINLTFHWNFFADSVLQDSYRSNSGSISRIRSFRKVVEKVVKWKKTQKQSWVRLLVITIILRL